MKILLIAPPVFDFYNSPHRMEPLGLFYIKKALENKNHSIEIYDASFSGKVKKIKTPDEFNYLDKYYTKDFSPFSLHSGYKRFGDSFQKISLYCSNNKFDLIGISSLFSAYHPDVELLASEIKKLTDTPVVIGGTAVNFLSDQQFKRSVADFMISGCGTVSMPVFAEALSGETSFLEVPGLIYEKNGEIIRNMPSKEPAWYGDLIPERKNIRIFRKKKIAKTIFSSGCHNRCAFCSIHIDNKFFIRSIPDIRKELEYLHNIGVEIVDIEDDDLFSQSDHAEELISLLKEFHSKGMQFTAMNGITAGNILSFAQALPDAGFIKLDLSLVCRSASTSKEMKRPHTFTDVKKIIDAVKGKTEIEVFMIPGLPDTSQKDILSTMIHLHRFKIKCGLSPLYLVPGVPMFEKSGIPENLRLCRGSALYPFSDMERDNIATLLKISRFLNYSLTAVKNDEYKENLSFFIKSLKRKKWLKKTKEGSWIDSFETGTLPLEDILQETLNL